MPFLLDASFIIDVHEGHPGARAVLKELKTEGALVFIPAIAGVEFLRGARDLEADFAGLEGAGAILDFTDRDVVASARLAQELARAGRFPGIADALIAGLARSRGDLTIVTANPKHFPLSKTRSYR
ncbi:MAG: type II toxin-antitoxin system VapC family toxin [Thermoplasmatota archaeon]